MLSCGLKCEHANILWGYNDNETNIINIVVLICCVLFLVIIVIVGINNFMDIHFYHLRCCVRPFIFHATIILTVSYSIVAFTLFAPHIFSKDNIVCNDDINNQKTVSCMSDRYIYVESSVICVYILFTVRNPGNHFTKCAVMGTLFYFGTLLAGLYTMAFSFALYVVIYLFTFLSVYSSIFNIYIDGVNFIHHWYHYGRNVRITPCVVYVQEYKIVYSHCVVILFTKYVVRIIMY